MKNPLSRSKLLFLSLSFFLLNYAFAQQTCNGSLLFDQTNDIAVNLPATNHYYTAVNGGYTWECWIKLNSVPGSTSNDRQIISSIDWTLYEDMYLGFGWHGGVQNRGYDSLVFKVDPPGAATPVDLNCAWAPAGGFVVGQWYHVTGVADYNAQMKYLYVDCILVDSEPLTVAPNTRVIPTNLSSCNTCAGPNSLDGYMDEVRIWDKPLSSSELSQYCNQCLSGTEPNLFLYYRCNQVGALSVLDATGNFNNGSFLNPPSPGWSTQNAPVSGTACQDACKCLGSLDFNTSTNPSVKLPFGNPYYDGVTNNGYTWETWFKLNTRPGSTKIDRCLISAIDNIQFEDMYLGFGWHSGFFDRGYDSLVFKVDGPASAWPVDLNCAWAPIGGFLVNTWYHAAGVADYNANMKYLYVNGIQVDAQAMTVLPNTDKIQTNLSACSVCGPANSINGKMDEVRIWNSPLSATDIFNFYQKCRAGTETDLIAYYRCNQVGASNVIDGSMNGYTAFFTGSMGWSTENAPVTGTCMKDCNKGDGTQDPPRGKTAGIETLSSTNGGLKIYPNPSSGSIKVSSEQPGVLTVYSVTGQVLSEIQVQKSEHEVKLEGYKPGIYLYVFTSGSSTSSGKLIIEN